jgi:hypothetical protein
MDDHAPEEEPSPRPPIAQAPISVILLAVGTASDAAESVGAWRAYLATLARPTELLLVPLVEVAANPVLAKVPHVAYDAERGIGPALEAAIRAAQYPLIVLTTADQQYQPADLQKLLTVIDKVDMVVGCRSAGRPALWRRALGGVGRAVGWLLIGLPFPAHPCVAGATSRRRRWAARWLFSVRLADPECVFRLMRREAAQRIVLQSRGWFALVEQLAKANHLEFIMAEEPIAWSPPAALPADPASFAHVARSLFGHPDFGPPELHVSPPPAPLPENPAPAPTTPPSGSS